METNPPHKPPYQETNEDTPEIGGGTHIIEYWAQKTLSPQGSKLWKTLLHKSACLSCSWGTGGQKGGFSNETGEKLQRCMKSVEAISAEIQPGLSTHFFDTNPIARLYLQPIPGSDVALFVGIQKALMGQGRIERDFLQSHTQGWEAVLEQAQTTDWETITTTCGVSRAEIETAAVIIGTSKRVVFGWAMGITQQTNGVDNVFSIANTALISGNVGKMGAGVMPVRGHSNVQGFGSMGVTVKLKAEIKQALERLLGRPLTLPKGYHTRDLIEAAEAGKVDSLLCVGGNLYGANPDSAQAKRALGNIDTIIYLATKPNIG